MRVLFLDIDGVLNRTGFVPPATVGLRSWIEPELAARLVTILEAIDAKIVLSTSWRIDSTLDELRAELHASGIDASWLLDMTPDLPGEERWSEIAEWMTRHAIAPDDVVILEDVYKMGPLAARAVMIDPDTGLDGAAAGAVMGLFSA